MSRKSIFSKDYEGFESSSDIYRDISEMLDPAFNPLAEGISPEFQGTLAIDVTYQECVHSFSNIRQDGSKTCSNCGVVEPHFDSKVLKLTEDLEVSLDIDGFPEEIHKTVPVFLFVPKREREPDMSPSWHPSFSFIEDAEHYHIMLSKEKAIELRDWLSSYLWSIS